MPYFYKKMSLNPELGHMEKIVSCMPRFLVICGV